MSSYLVLALVAKVFWGEQESCLDKIDPSYMRPVAVFAQTIVPDGVALAHRRSFATVTQAIASEANQLLQARETSTKAETLTWRQLDGRLRLTWKRDGRVVFRADSVEKRSPSTEPVALKAFAEAIDSLTRRGENFFPWPPSLRGDSADFAVGFTRNELDDLGNAVAVSDSLLVPFWSVAAPIERPPRVLLMGAVRYPARALRENLSAEFLAEFAVDTNGLADIASFHLRPIREGQVLSSGRFFADFQNAIREQVRAARFLPAEIGDCRVRQVIAQSLSFWVTPG